MPRPAQPDALSDTERTVLERWDAGDTLAAIAVSAGVPEARVARIVEHFEGESDWRQRARFASQRLAAACIASGGSFA